MYYFGDDVSQTSVGYGLEFILDQLVEAFYDVAVVDAATFCFLVGISDFNHQKVTALFEFCLNVVLEELQKLIEKGDVEVFFVKQILYELHQLFGQLQSFSLITHSHLQKLLQSDKTRDEFISYLFTVQFLSDRCSDLLFDVGQRMQIGAKSKSVLGDVFHFDFCGRVDKFVTEVTQV